MKIGLTSISVQARGTKTSPPLTVEEFIDTAKK